jgi:RNA polymerase sigma-70 factor (ECF subfamily)
MENFDTYYPLLSTIARRMLGNSGDAEDIVQESYIRYTTAALREIGSLKAYLLTIVTRLCLDHLKSARIQREKPFGLWASGSMLSEDAEQAALEDIERREAVSQAFLILLECLTPNERTVFLLHEVFGYSYEEIAEIMGKKAASCRQLLHRARARLIKRCPRFTTSQNTHEHLTESFLMAARHGDIQALLDATSCG